MYAEVFLSKYLKKTFKLTDMFISDTIIHLCVSTFFEVNSTIIIVFLLKTEFKPLR